MVPAILPARRLSLASAISCMHNGVLNWSSIHVKVFPSREYSENGKDCVPSSANASYARLAYLPFEKESHELQQGS